MHFENFKFILLACSVAFIAYQVDSLQFCGDQLPEALSKICTNGFNTKMKRTVPMDYNSIDNLANNDNALGNFGAYSDIDFETQPLLRALLGESAHQLMTTRRRRYFGIHDECCKKPCSFEELTEYCARY